MFNVSALLLDDALLKVKAYKKVCQFLGHSVWSRRNEINCHCTWLNCSLSAHHVRRPPCVILVTVRDKMGTKRIKQLAYLVHSIFVYTGWPKTGTFCFVRLKFVKYWPIFKLGPPCIPSATAVHVARRALATSSIWHQAENGGERRRWNYCCSNCLTRHRPTCASDSLATYGAIEMCFDWLIDWYIHMALCRKIYLVFRIVLF